MTNQVLKIFATLSLLILLAGVSVSATAGKLRVAIPFDFTAGGKALPAGEYFVKRVARSGTLAIESQNGRERATINTQATSRSKMERSQLVFNRYGDQNFLSQIWTADEDAVYQVSRSVREREAAKNARYLAQQKAEPEVVIVAAQ